MTQIKVICRSFGTTAKKDWPQTVQRRYQKTSSDAFMWVTGAVWIASIPTQDKLSITPRQMVYLKEQFCSAPVMRKAVCGLAVLAPAWHAWFLNRTNRGKGRTFY